MGRIVTPGASSGTRNAVRPACFGASGSLRQIAAPNWALVPEGQEGFAADSEPLKTINYGGGARWFAKPHLAFSLDVRFYAINPGTPYIVGPDGPVGSPRTTLLIIGAGISLK